MGRWMSPQDGALSPRWTVAQRTEALHQLRTSPVPEDLKLFRPDKSNLCPELVTPAAIFLLYLSASSQLGLNSGTVTSGFPSEVWEAFRVPTGLLKRTKLVIQ